MKHRIEIVCYSPEEAAICRLTLELCASMSRDLKEEAVLVDGPTALEALASLFDKLIDQINTDLTDPA